MAATSSLPTRKRQTKKPTALPKEFVKTVADLFHKQFKAKLSGSTFLVYGSLYPDEVVLCVSLSHPKSLPSASMHISNSLAKNVAENPEKVTEQLKSMVDVAASWFSQCFSAGSGLEAVLGEMKDANTEWQEFEWEGQQLFVKLNRTNYTLEKAAADFLKKKGFSEEGDDPLDELDEFDDDEPLN
jgi:hypothetical protein